VGICWILGEERDWFPTRKGKNGRKKEKYEQKNKNGKVKKKEREKGKERKIDLKHFNFRTVQPAADSSMWYLMARGFRFKPKSILLVYVSKPQDSANNDATNVLLLDLA